jgi:hypothetical protein
MNPLIKLNLPRLSDSLENKLISIASQYKEFKYNNGTLGKKYYEQKESLEEIENLKQIYGFDDLPQHRSCGIGSLTQEVIGEMNHTFLNGMNMCVQVIESKDSFIHTDGGHRICSLYYLISDDTSKTTFYESDKPPVLTTVWNPMDVHPYYSYTMEQHKWHAFSHNEIHSVNNIKSLRIGLIIDFTPKFKTYDDFINFLSEHGLIDE